MIDFYILKIIIIFCLFLGLNIIGSFFNSYGDIEDIDADLRYKYINIIKMTVYIFIEFVNSFNLKIETDYKLILLQTKVFLTYNAIVYNSIIRYIILFYKIFRVEIKNKI